MAACAWAATLGAPPWHGPVVCLESVGPVESEAADLVSLLFLRNLKTTKASTERRELDGTERFSTARQSKKERGS